MTLTALLLTTLISIGGTTSTERFALVIGNNLPLADTNYEPLRYADDDAIRFALFMRQLGADTELLVAPDNETQQRFAHTNLSSTSPRRQELKAAVARLKNKLRASSSEREVYVYFSGHGSVTSSSAYVHLLDKPLYREDLFDEIIKELPHERMHVIVDSCHSYFLVNSRGRVAAAHQTSAADFPEVGFLLSTSDRREVHEWSGYQAGVFSYELLGALRGAGDIDGDGQVSYDEARAYVIAANLEVKNPRARVQPHIRAPNRPGQSLVDLRPSLATSQITIPENINGRLRLVDNYGYPVLDANKPAGQVLKLALLRQRDTRLQTRDVDYALDPETGAFTPLPANNDEAIRSRGSIEDDFRRNLFARPLTSDFVAGIAAANRTSVTETEIELRTAPIRAWYKDPLTLSMGGVGVATFATGATFGILFATQVSRANQRPVTSENERARSRAENYRTAMAIGLGAGGALIGAAILNAWLDRTGSDLALAPAGAGVGVAGRF